MENKRDLIAEVESFITDNENKLVLIEDDGAFRYEIVHRDRQGFIIFEEEEFVHLMIQRLLEMNVEIFESRAQLRSKYEQKLERPMFYPEHLPWPPDGSKKK